MTSGSALNPNKATGVFQAILLDEAAAETVGQCLAVWHVGQKPGARRAILVGDAYQRKPYVASEVRMRTALFTGALQAAVLAGASEVRLNVTYRCPKPLINAISLAVTGEMIDAQQAPSRGVGPELHELNKT